MTRRAPARGSTALLPTSSWPALALLLLGLATGISLFPGSVLQAQEVPSRAGSSACPSPAAIAGDMSVPMAHVRYLADDALEGREAGTAGARCAAEYIAGYFRELGLEPPEEGGGYFQPFHVRMGAVLGGNNLLAAPGTSFSVEEDWIPFGFSAASSVEAPLVYGGPGVSRPGEEDDRFTRLDLEGRIVVVEGDSPHAGPGNVTADPHFKATVAAGRGASGVLILLPEGEGLPDPEAERRPTLPVPVAAVAPGAAAALRTAARDEEAVRLVTSLEPRMVEIRNVVGLLPGGDPALEGEVVVVGAHYDHLGLGGEGSLDPDAREVHNGADDNASGTAALMDVARRMAEAPGNPARSVLFVAFTGEEKGLWGSSHYTEDPLRPLEATVAMLNMDMVGRLRENTLTVYGTGTAEEWPATLAELNRELAHPFVLSSIPDGFGASDQASFYGEGIPVLHFFTNTHPQYHRPEDDWDLVDEEGLERIAAFVEDVTWTLAGSPRHGALALTAVEGAGNPHGAMMASPEEGEEERAGRGYGPSLGTIPDMTPRDFGVRITGVRDGSPAEKAGLRSGDVIVEFAGKEITDLYAYTYALRAQEPGDEVTIVVLRGEDEEERVTLTATLGRRR